MSHSFKDDVKDIYNQVKDFGKNFDKIALKSEQTLKGIIDETKTDQKPKNDLPSSYGYENRGVIEGDGTINESKI